MKVLVGIAYMRGLRGIWIDEDLVLAVKREADGKVLLPLAVGLMELQWQRDARAREKDLAAHDGALMENENETKEQNETMKSNNMLMNEECGAGNTNGGGGGAEEQTGAPGQGQVQAGEGPSGEQGGGNEATA